MPCCPAASFAPASALLLAASLSQSVGRSSVWGWGEGGDGGMKAVMPLGLVCFVLCCVVCAFETIAVILPPARPLCLFISLSFSLSFSLAAPLGSQAQAQTRLPQHDAQPCHELIPHTPLHLVHLGVGQALVHVPVGDPVGLARAPGLAVCELIEEHDALHEVPGH